MTNIVQTFDTVKKLQSQGHTVEQILSHFPEGPARWQAEGILGIDCDPEDDLDFEETE